MKFLVRNRFRNCIIGGIIMMMLFGCASTQETSVSQKYEASKSWFKEKWKAVGSKFSSSEDEEPSIKPHHQKPNYFVYQTRWYYETLSGIAEWFTGDSENWKALAAANPKVRPKRIAAGSMILIPAKLIKNKKLPTEAFAARHRIYYFEHRVKWPGETLSLIAGWYTGRYGNWKAIAKANPGLNPNRIAVGNIICIPPEMMKTQKPLPRKVVSKTLPGYFAHTVIQSNEKFSAIARWYTGNAENRRAIAKANPDIDPEFLRVGDEIYIPSSLLKTRKSMVATNSNQLSKAKSAKKPTTTEADTATPSAAKPKKIQLFGPKQFPAH
jgi:hypothetical protein